MQPSLKPGGGRWTSTTGIGQPDRGTPTPACALVDGDWQGKVKIKDATVNGTIVDF